MKKRLLPRGQNRARLACLCASLLALPVLGLSSCGPSPGPVQPQGSGCNPTSFDLTDDLASGPAEAMLQLNCYRSRMDASLAVMNAALNEAAQLHAEYLDATDSWGHTEDDTSQATFRGATPGERAAVAGFEIDDHTQSISELLGYRETGADASAAVDLWMDTVYHRLPIAIPELEAVGFGSAGIYDVMLIVSPWEAEAQGPDFLSHVYPVPGQMDTPTTFDSDREFPDPAPSRGLVGFPISISFLDQSFHEPLDLYDLRVEIAELRDSSGGVVPAQLFSPAEDDLVLRSAILMPVDPLSTGSSYSVQFSGTVGGSLFDETWSFETNTEAD